MTNPVYAEVIRTNNKVNLDAVPKQQRTKEKRYIGIRPRRLRAYMLLYVRVGYLLAIIDRGRCTYDVCIMVDDGAMILPECLIIGTASSYIPRAILANYW